MLTTVRDLGAAVRNARDAAGLSQQELADRAGVHRQWVTRLETGASPAAEMRRVFDVLAVLGLGVELVPLQADDHDDPFADMFGSPS
jgi:HTH-type transcriptional regulator / antitoxin HipB